MTDLLVAGGGPVGLATAALAAGQGMRVVLVEPRPHPVDKACGEGLMPSALAALSRLGVEPPGRAFAGIGYRDGRAQVEARFPAGPGRGVRRTELVRALGERADALGVERVQRRVEGVRLDARGVVAAGLRASWLAAADGLHSPLRRQLGLDAPRRGVARYGLRRHYRVAPWSDLVEVHWARDAEAYVTPVGEELVGVAVLCRGGAPYGDWLARFPALAERLSGAQPVTGVRGAGPLRQGASGLRRGRALLVGDAAGYLDALTGEGIAVGLAGAEVLVGCLLAGRPQDYERQWHRVSRRSRTLTGGLLWAATRPALRRRVVPWSAAAPAAFGSLVRALA